MEAILFAVNEKAEAAAKLMNQYRDDYNKDNYNFWRGQYLAFTEMYSLLSNAKL
jgi:protein involved in sex pheromone biosynthesis